MNKNEYENIDILKELDISLNTAEIDTNKIIESSLNNLENNDILATESISGDYSVENILEEVTSIQENIIEKEEKKEEDIDILKSIESNNPIQKTKRNSFVSGSIFLTKYILTSTLIFAVLLLTTNYSAYLNIAKSYIFAGELKITQQKIISSVEASNIKEKFSEVIVEEKKEEKKKTEKLSINKMKKDQEKERLNLNIDITPYENRIIIPKIGKNIPLIDIKNRNIDGEKELNNIFMKELEKGIIRYPGSAKPGESGTSFIFGHSSNFPWVKGEYNDVFALLDKVEYSDEIIVYYGQEKYVYKIKEKKVITPGDVSVLERNKDRSEITLMTCWPIGTTLNRLIVTGELIKKIN